MIPNLSQQPLELWAGVECTVNRVRDEYFDQLERNGHATRIADLNLFAALGVRAMRYPVLWERTAPDSLEQLDWSWPDERLRRLHELGIRPIVGLLHHGSGPRYTSLVDSAFPEKLAAYARSVAARYPWVESYTPVNEPLTTARFSGLYGHWYPHGADDSTFLRILLAECRATILAMRAIREVNSNARLIQTEDLGKTYSTRTLSYQAEFENERRWLSLDLLCGRVNRTHPLWEYLTKFGIKEAELAWFTENACAPNLVGINHYLTSERFLDERLERYPSSTHGGNEHHRYADVEAVRVCAEGTAGPRVLLRETWERYRLPMAVTEVHLGCTRDEQLRWLKEVWEAAASLREDGADMRAVTAWSLLGAYDWSNLLTCNKGHYEPGVFDLRGGVTAAATAAAPRPTALARMLQDLAAGRRHGHPVLAGPGWWRRLNRLIYPPVRRESRLRGSVDNNSRASHRTNMSLGTSRPILITGATGTLGRAFARLCDVRGLSYQLLTRGQLDIANPASVEAALDEFEPWAVVNAAGYVRVDDAEREREACFRENTTGPETLAKYCAGRAIKLLTFSSDLVFDGLQQTPYVESDHVSPLNVYGQSKAAAEARVLKLHPSSLVIRTSAFFGPWDEHNFITVALRELSARRAFVAADDALVSPTYVPDLVHACLDLLIDDESGLWHLANGGAVTWAELARSVATLAGLDSGGVEARTTTALNLPARRPLYSVLGSERGALLPSLEDALARYLRERETKLQEAATDNPEERKLARAASARS
jgi:dTDP-4-dehydrorhamnose reductase